MEVALGSVGLRGYERQTLLTVGFLETARCGVVHIIDNGDDRTIIIRIVDVSSAC